MTSAPPTGPLPQMPPRPGEPVDPELRERYRTDASRQREVRRSESVRLAAAEPSPSRTPVGPIRVIALLVSLALVLLAGLFMVGPMLKQSETTERSLTVTDTVRFKGTVGDVRVRSAEPGESPRAVITSTWGLWKPTNTVRTTGGVTELTSTCPSQSIGPVCEVDWLVVLPADTALDISHGVGQVAVEGTTGDIDVEVGVGDVSVAESQAQDVFIQIGVGRADVEAVEPPRRISGRVGVGEIAVRVPDTVPYRVDTRSGTAEVANSIGDDPTASRVIDVESGVGRVSIDPS